MFYLTGKENVLRTVVLLGKTTGEPVTSFEQLRLAYLAFLRSFLPSTAYIPTNTSSQYCTDIQTIRKLSRIFMSDCELTDIETRILDDLNDESIALALERVKNAQENIKTIDPDIYELFQLVIHTIFYAKSLDSGGGSVSEALGMIWCSNRKSWSMQDLSEFLFHEFTHNLLFLDEVCYKHYVSYGLIAKQEHYALSAILKINRPLDKVFHSLVVAHEIINFRLNTQEPENPKVHPSTKDMVENSLKTIKSIYNVLDTSNEKLVTPRFMGILGMVEKSIINIKQTSFSDIQAVAV